MPLLLGLDPIGDDHMIYRVEQCWAGSICLGRVDEKKVESRINELASEGWEVVSTTALNRFFGETHNLVVTFKREA